MFAWVSSPFMITVWCSGPLVTAFLNQFLPAELRNKATPGDFSRSPGWRWFYTVFAVITLVVALPLYFLFSFNYRKAIKAGIIAPEKSNRCFCKSMKHYFIEFDIPGQLLLAGGLVFVLLPFSLYSRQVGGWSSPLVVSFWSIGILMLVG